MNLILRLRCWYRGVHTPRRHHALSGFTCLDCGHVAADLSGMGYGRDAGHVSILRRLYERDRGLTRTSEWNQTRRGW